MNMYNSQAQTVDTLPERLFASLDRTFRGSVCKQDILRVLEDGGLPRSDERLRHLHHELEHYGLTEDICVAEFERIIAPHISLFRKAVDGELAIPDFSGFSAVVESIYDIVQENRSGAVADYIPQLARVCPDEFAVSICTLDGQQINLGNAQV